MLFVQYNLENDLIKKIAPWRTIEYIEAEKYINNSIEKLFLFTDRADRIGKGGSLRVSERQWIVLNSMVDCLKDMLGDFECSVSYQNDAMGITPSEHDAQEFVRKQLQDSIDRFEKQAQVISIRDIGGYIPDDAITPPDFIPLN